MYMYVDMYYVTVVIIVKLVSDCCLTSSYQFFIYIMLRTSYIQWDDNGDCFVLHQHA
jgi:hypothetical protein